MGPCFVIGGTWRKLLCSKIIPPYAPMLPHSKRGCLEFFKLTKLACLLYATYEIFHTIYAHVHVISI